MSGDLNVVIIRDAQEKDLAAITAIYNEAVLNTLAIWNETVVDVENRRRWYKARKVEGFPVVVATDKEGEVIGYASYTHFRPFSGYRYSFEHSIYVKSENRDKGVGKILLARLIEEAKKKQRPRPDRRYRGGERPFHRPAQGIRLQGNRKNARGRLQERPLAGSGFHAKTVSSQLTFPLMLFLSLWSGRQADFRYYG